MNLLINDDCFEGFKKIKKYSLNLILVDLPYGSTDYEWDEKINLDEMWKQLKKISKPNAIYIFFCDSKLGNDLMNSNINGFKYSLVWAKPNSTSFISCNARPMNIHEMIYLFRQDDRYPDKEKEQNIEERKYGKQIKKYINESQTKIDEKIGNMGTHHFFNDSQFGIPTKINYEKMTSIYNLQDMPNYKTYDELKKNFSITNKYKYNPQMTTGTPYTTKGGSVNTVNKSLKQKKSIVNEGTRHPTSILYYGYDKNKIHPTQKPVELLKWLIKSYTDEGDLVLDFCMGSGSTIIACLETNRKYIGIEKNEYFFKQAEERIQEHIKGNKDHAPTVDITKKYIYIE